MAKLVKEPVPAYHLDAYRLEGCCAVREIDGISLTKGPAQTIFGLIEWWSRNQLTLKRKVKPFPGFFLFSAVLVNNEVKPAQTLSYGPELATYIEENDLGDVSWSLPNINPNSGNLVQLYVWAVDAKALKAHAKLLAKRFVTV